MRRAALLAFVLLAPGAAIAQQRAPQPPRQEELPQQVERNIRTCIGTSQEMALVARCMDSQRAVVAPRLETAVERLLATQADPARRAGLAAVQAAWANYRDLRCDFAGTNPERGADAAADRAACLLQFDLGRTMEIEQLLAPPPAAAAPQQRQQQQRR
ncbi:lysozyme inhibitor LprI family protein [Roseomonas sp. CAU 1739]|uniref:lysozyme inhibitor LprI family protein n=1 Tax=Roseomonas sp. CAU 1739 TaxID=3140364 RepID=UPI00325BF382